MKKIFSFILCAAAFALTFTSCSEEDNSVYPNDVVVRNGYYLNNIIADALEKEAGSEITVTIPDTVVLRVDNKVIEIPEGKTVTVIGNVNAPARLWMTNPLQVDGNLTIKNADIDGKNKDAEFISFAADKSNIVFDNVKIENFASNLIGWQTEGATITFTNSDLAYGWSGGSAILTIKDSKLTPNGATSINAIGGVENVEIDASNCYDFIFNMNWPGYAGIEQNEAGYYIIDNLNLKDITVKGAKGGIFALWYNCIFKNFTVDNLDFEFDLDYNYWAALFGFYGGGALNFTVQNSKFYPAEGCTYKYFNFTNYSWGNDYPVPEGAGEDAEWSFVYSNNTFDSVVRNYWHEGGSYFKTDLLSIDVENNTWIDNQTEVADIDIIKTLRRWHDAEDLKSVVVKDNKISQTLTYDFAAVAEAGENPSNLNGNANNGQKFFVWWNEGAKNRNTNQYKGYQNSGVLPSVCHVWRSNDRINGNIVEGGLKCPNDRPMVVDGLAEGSIVKVYYDATEAAEDAKELVWGAAIDDEGNVNGATAKIGDTEAVSMETTIPSGEEIVVTSITPEQTTGTGYIVFWEKKGMVISKIVITNTTDK